MNVLSGHILVTGASSGIGQEMALQLSPTAQSLILVARREARLMELANRCRAINASLVVHVLPCDLSQPESVRSLLKQIADAEIPVTALINNAGLGHIGLFESAEPAQIERMLMVNVVGLTLLTRGLLPKIIASDCGGILNVSSGFGLTWMPFFSAYVGTKHYVSSFNVALRSELSGTGVTVSQLCPGPVATEFEAVAGNPLGASAPSWFELSAARCAELGLRGFSKGRELIIPGMAAWLAINSGRLTPRFILRILYGIIGRKMRLRLKQRPKGSGIV